MTVFQSFESNEGSVDEHHISLANLRPQIAGVRRCYTSLITHKQ